MSKSEKRTITEAEIDALLEELQKAICKVVGHKWQAISGGATEVSVAEVCLRCRDNGWLI